MSLDAIHDERFQRGLIFPGRVALAQSSIRVGEHQIPLTAGMNTTVEIILRKRRIIAFFLSPLLKYFGQKVFVSGSHLRQGFALSRLFLPLPKK